MTTRERFLACMHYESYDRLPVLEFGFWAETWPQWVAEGRVSPDCLEPPANGHSRGESQRLGFEANYSDDFFQPDYGPRPAFEHRVLKTHPDGTREVMSGYGVVMLVHPEAVSISAEIAHTLKDRKSWEQQFKPRLQFDCERYTKALVNVDPGNPVRYGEGGAQALCRRDRTHLYGLHCGSLLGFIRDCVGVSELAYLMVDDEPLLDEIIQTISDLNYRIVNEVLSNGAQFDCAHFWEDICFRSGPLISPAWFEAKIGPHYRRITDLLRGHGIRIVSVDCDGCIDALIPTWLNNGVNTMFPIEVGTWEGSIKPWRELYGRELRGIGGMNKNAFLRDHNAVDQEIDRLKHLVALGGYIPCPDHRIPPNAKWENVRYYCDKIRDILG